MTPGFSFDLLLYLLSFWSPSPSRLVLYLTRLPLELRGKKCFTDEVKIRLASAWKIHIATLMNNSDDSRPDRGYVADSQEATTCVIGFNLCELLEPTRLLRLGTSNLCLF